jgi:NAD(P)-dependent dehydrogenase (short-subunit alcohol dehydrogenase family)
MRCRLAAYGATKAGLMAVTHSVAVELGEHGILVNAVIHGATMTAERMAAMQSGDMKELFEASGSRRLPTMLFGPLAIIVPAPHHPPIVL